MRIAILADIHGNLPAFEAALAHVANEGVDQIVLAGDIVNGSPDSARCWQLARSLNCPMLRGNHERYVFDYGTSAANSLWETELFSPVQWTVSQFTDRERAAMAKLPMALRLPEMADLLLTHASPKNDQQSIRPYSPQSVVQEIFGDVAERTIVRGHNHLNSVYRWRDKQIITVGSVGLPLDSNPSAQYNILERCKNQWHNKPQAVTYDVEATLRRFKETGYLEAAYPMSRLFLREVATASYAFTPFLRTYQHWKQTDPDGLGALSLATAIDTFLKFY